MNRNEVNDWSCGLGVQSCVPVHEAFPSYQSLNEAQMHNVLLDQ